jgi:class 3 adenylate cyclase
MVRTAPWRCGWPLLGSVRWMRIEAGDPCPLPDDPVLAEWATAMRDMGDWGWIVDSSWKLRFVTDEQRLSMATDVDMVPLLIGEHMFAPEMTEMITYWWTGRAQREPLRGFFANVGGLVLADTAGGKAELRSVLDPSLTEMVDELSPSHANVTIGTMSATVRGGLDGIVLQKTHRIRDAEGGLRGTAIIFKPAVGMNVLGTMALERDIGHVERLHSMARARRRPTAILFADLEGSSALSRTLSTSSYFAAVRQIVRATDRCVVDAGGLVGRHVGDGVVAFFPVEVFDSESAAARACIRAARGIEAAMPDVASRRGLPTEQLVMRFGLHWGSTIYMGNIGTLARSEVTALGDEVNEAARIEACATGGRLLASKPLLERLTDDDAATLGIDPDQLAYTQLAHLTTATEKARRDAPAIAVCEL